MVQPDRLILDFRSLHFVTMFAKVPFLVVQTTALNHMSAQVNTLRLCALGYTSLVWALLVGQCHLIHLYTTR